MSAKPILHRQLAILYYSRSLIRMQLTHSIGCTKKTLFALAANATYTDVNIQDNAQ